ncbi:hypothetical protein B7R21_02765 [Subtercola boreus]|uniref:Uncharacterized protein n=1 Tax=Subtercola boreus TaxID=120213 RepID=A0A3E0W3D5_9MICO|nr:hypothetical protein B7R21_02765 [Subtercola boreus]
MTATLAWIDPPGVQNESSLLMLTLQPPAAGGPVIRGTGTLTLTVLESYAYSPARAVLPPAGWTVTGAGSSRTITVVAPPGVTAGSKGFNVDWGELSGNWTVVATWTESGASGSVSSTIVVGPRGFPALDWTTNPAAFGGTSTLRLTVPANCYAIGTEASILVSKELPAGGTIGLPSGWSLAAPYFGYSVLHTTSTAGGSFDFDFVFGSGTAPVTVVSQWGTPAAGSTPVSPAVQLRLENG